MHKFHMNVPMRRKGTSACQKFIAKFGFFFLRVLGEEFLENKMYVWFCIREMTVLIFVQENEKSFL